MNITEKQKESLTAEATKIFIQDPALDFFSKAKDISNIDNIDHVFKGPAELIKVSSSSISDPWTSNQYVVFLPTEMQGEQ